MKRTISILLSVIIIMCSTMISFAASAGVVFAVQNVDVSGSDRIVTVPISISENCGIAGGDIKIVSELEIDSISEDSIFDILANPKNGIINWSGTKNKTTIGVVAYVNFVLPKTFTENQIWNVSVSVNSLKNENLGNVNYSVTAGKITATEDSISNCNYVASVIKEPSCSIEGIMEYVCSDCKDTYRETIPALGYTPISDFEYTVNGTDITITKYNGTDPVVVIKDTYTILNADYSVIAIDDYTSGRFSYGAFEDADITSITIPECVESISSYSFYGCNNLTMYGYFGSYAEDYATQNSIPFVLIKRPSDDTPISAFEYTLSNNEITITKYLGSKTKVKIGEEYEIDGVSYIVTGIDGKIEGRYKIGAFEDSAASYIIVPLTVTNIYDYAFYGCNTIEGFSGTVAEEYATSNSVTFVSDGIGEADVTEIKIGTNITELPNFTSSDFLSFINLNTTEYSFENSIVTFSSDYIESLPVGKTAEVYKVSDTEAKHKIIILNKSDKTPIEKLINNFDAANDLYVGKKSTSDILVLNKMFNAETLNKSELGYHLSICDSLGNQLSSAEFVGTGSIAMIKDDNDVVLESVEIVRIGDLNGDGVCDVLDAVLTEKMMNNHSSYSDIQIFAANGFESNEINTTSYQNVVNKVLAE